jgi:hypothetical protein
MQMVWRFPARVVVRMRSRSALDNCMASHGIRVVMSYQPASRYWPLQLTEIGLFRALALALAGLCFWRLGRRLS